MDLDDRQSVDEQTSTHDELVYEDSLNMGADSPVLTACIQLHKKFNFSSHQGSITLEVPKNKKSGGGPRNVLTGQVLPPVSNNQIFMPKKEFLSFPEGTFERGEKVSRFLHDSYKALLEGFNENLKLAIQERPSLEKFYLQNPNKEQDIKRIINAAEEAKNKTKINVIDIMRNQELSPEIIPIPEEAPIKWMDRRKPELLAAYNKSVPPHRQIYPSINSVDFIRTVYADWIGINLLKTDIRHFDMSLYKRFNIDMSQKKDSFLEIYLPTKTEIYTAIISGKHIEKGFLDRVDKEKLKAAHATRKSTAIAA